MILFGADFGADFGMNPGNDVRFLIIVIGQMLVIGICFGCPNKISLVDSEPPAIPRALYCGDRQIVVRWFPNGERDLAGYRVWRSQDGQDLTQNCHPRKI